MIPDFCELRAFDTEVLGKPVWVLTDPFRAQEAVEAAQDEGIGLLFCRGAISLAESLEPWGFRPVEDLVSFEAAVPESKLAKDGRLRAAVPEEAVEVGQLAVRSFYTTRWHLDPEIPDEKANAYKARWVENSVRGRAVCVLLSVSQAGEISGFNALMAKGETLVIDLIAVVPEARGQGLGKALVAGAFSYAQRQGYARVQVGTQSVNEASIGLYTAMGFNEIGRQRSWHLTP